MKQMKPTTNEWKKKGGHNSQKNLKMGDNSKESGQKSRKLMGGNKGEPKGGRPGLGG